MDDDDDREATRQADFPITRQWAYLDHATFGPFPAAAVAAMAAVGQALSEDVLGRTVGASALLESVRERAARLVHCATEHLALLRSTGEGLSLVAAGLDWRAGDEVIGYERDFPGTLAAWRHLADRGVVLRLVPARADHTFACADVERPLTPRTRLVCLSLVQYGSGFRAPIEEIVGFAEQPTKLVNKCNASMRPPARRINGPWSSSSPPASCSATHAAPGHWRWPA